MSGVWQVTWASYYEGHARERFGRQGGLHYKGFRRSQIRNFHLLMTAACACLHDGLESIQAPTGSLVKHNGCWSSTIMAHLSWTHSQALLYMGFLNVWISMGKINRNVWSGIVSQCFEILILPDVGLELLMENVVLCEIVKIMSLN